jgi:hypothetical protein
MLTSSTARRINKSFLVLLALTSLCLLAIAQQTTRNPQASPGKPAVVPVADGAGTQKLPLRRIVLYKSGVGYFEHAGTVRGNAGVEIDLTRSQLDDVLKSLTALDLNGGRIVGASYNSEEPIGHQFQSLPVPVAAKTTLTSLLEELRGSRLEVRTATGAFTGRLLSVQNETQHKAGTDVSLDQISLLGDRGEVPPSHSSRAQICALLTVSLSRS